MLFKKPWEEKLGVLDNDSWESQSHFAIKGQNVNILGFGYLWSNVLLCFCFRYSLRR